MRREKSRALSASTTSWMMTPAFAKFWIFPRTGKPNARPTERLGNVDQSHGCSSHRPRRLGDERACESRELLPGWVATRADVPPPGRSEASRSRVACGDAGERSRERPLGEAAGAEAVRPRTRGWGTPSRSRPRHGPPAPRGTRVRPGDRSVHEARPERPRGRREPVRVRGRRPGQLLGSGRKLRRGGGGGGGGRWGRRSGLRSGRRGLGPGLRPRGNGVRLRRDTIGCRPRGGRRRSGRGGGECGRGRCRGGE